MASESKFLAFDLGASGGRALLGQLNEGRLAISEVHRWANEGICAAGTYYWDALRLFDEMKHGLRSAVQSHGKDIAGAGLDTWGVDFALLGTNDVLLGNPVCYRDARTDGMVEEAEKIVSRREIYERTGIQFMQLNTLFQMLALSRQNRWQFDAAKTMLMIPDLFNFWFTGEKVCEFTEATTSQMYDPNAKDWARPLLDKLNIPTHCLPTVVSPGTVLGNILPAIAEETCSGSFPFIAPACHDTNSAVAAVPASGKDHIYISTGTWMLVGVESQQPVINDKTFALNFTNEGGVAGTFCLLGNITGLWLVQECRRIWAQAGQEFTFAQLTDMAAAAEPFRSLINPDDPAFLKPCDMPSRIRDYCRKNSQPLPESEGQVIRTALDSLALRCRMLAENLDMLMGKRLSPIHMVGGGIQNRLLCRLIANVTGRPVVAGPVEATAIGNIIIQAIALRHISSIEEARDIVRRSFEVLTYEPEPDSRIDEAYGKFKTLVPK